MFVKSSVPSWAQKLRGICLVGAAVVLSGSLACSGTTHYVLHGQGLSVPACSFVIRDKQDGEVCAIDGKAGENRYSFWTMNPFPVVPGKGCPGELRYNNESSGTFEADLAPGHHSIEVKPWEASAFPRTIEFDCAANKTYTVKMSEVTVSKSTANLGALLIENGVWQASVVEAQPVK
jgi:hypothetical protein